MEEEVKGNDDGAPLKDTKPKLRNNLFISDSSIRTYAFQSKNIFIFKECLLLDTTTAPAKKKKLHFNSTTQKMTWPDINSKQPLFKVKLLFNKGLFSIF